MKRIPFFRHDLGQAELDAVAEVLAGPVLTTGETVERFERRFAEHLGCRHVVTVSSCTAGIQLALLGLGIGAGDEVITTPMSFIATATAVMQAGATPVFVDVEPDTGNLDAATVAEAITPRTRAILPVHLYGQMCDMRTLRALADRHRLALIEDAAHCIEGSREGIRVGQVSNAACFSFYATKNLTCGEGGAVATNDEALARKLRLLRLHGMTRTAADREREGYQHWDMVLFGWKYNLDNIQAALLLPQLDRLEERWQKREALAQRYLACLAEIDGVTTPALRPATRHARHLFPVWVREDRDGVVQALQEQGIGVVVNYRPMHLLSFFREQFGFQENTFPVAERIGGRTLSLPFYPSMPPACVDTVCGALRSAVRGQVRRAAA
jgi:dTDP-4-amino-4,6-dideoxygalactose transaminase